MKVNAQKLSVQGHSDSDSVQNISTFSIHRGEFKVANEFSLLGDKVGEVP